MGSYLQITPALKTKLGYGEVRGCYYGSSERRTAKSSSPKTARKFDCDVDQFDAEKDVFPYPDEYFDTVLCCELIEHLPSDPMHMMSEINRILKAGRPSRLDDTQHRVRRARSPPFCRAIIPASFPPTSSRPSPEPRSRRGMRASTRRGRFNSSSVMPASKLRFSRRASFAMNRTRSMAGFSICSNFMNSQQNSGGDGIYAVGVKRGPVRDRFPAWLYS